MGGVLGGRWIQDFCQITLQPLEAIASQTDPPGDFCARVLCAYMIAYVYMGVGVCETAFAFYTRHSSDILFNIVHFSSGDDWLKEFE